MKIKQKTVTDKVHELLAKQNEKNSEECGEESEEPRFTQIDDEDYELPQAQFTDFRKRNIKLLSEESSKYKGKIASRKELEIEEDNEENNSYEESDESDVDENVENLKNFTMKLMEENQNDRGEEEHTEFEEEDDISEESVINKTQKIFSESNRQTEIQKGACVQNQLRIWEKLLEMRIQSQKILTKANQLPAPEEFHEISNIETAKFDTVKSLSNLLNKLSDLKETLYQQYPTDHEEVKNQQKRPQINNSHPIDEPAIKRLGLDLEHQFNSMRSYRNNVLLKWDDRTKLMTPGAGNKRKSAQEDFDILKKVEHALSNRQGLIERSQVLKSSNKTSNNLDKIEEKSLPHIYDDSDFYHEQLRELIEYKANTSSNMSEVTKQYVELQKLRQKMKKKVDTRASKGRKLRYIVHKKLINFMSPEDVCSWSEQSKDELYKSLFAP